MPAILADHESQLTPGNLAFKRHQINEIHDDPRAITRLENHDTGRIGLRQVEALLIQTAFRIGKVEHDPRRLLDGVTLNICRGWLAKGESHFQLRAGLGREGDILDHHRCRYRRNAPETAHQQTDPACW